MGSVLVNRCPACSKPVAEKDEVCPFCGKDFSVPTAPRKLFTPAPDSAGKPPLPASALPAQEPPPPPPDAVPPSVYYEHPVAVPPPAALPPKEDPFIPPAVLYCAAALLVAAGFWMLYLRGAPPPAGQAPAPIVVAKPPPTAPESPPAATAPAVPSEPAPPAREEAPRKPRPAPARAPSPAPPPEEPPVIAVGRPARADELRIQGLAFDIATLQPVADVEIIFTDPVSGQRSATGTDAEGRFRARLPVNDAGYDMAVSHPDYEPRYLLDGDPPLRDLPRGKRIAAAVAETRTLQSKMLLPSHGDMTRRDIALIPLKLPAE